MKAKMSYKSKKIAIITAIIIVLVAAISTGVYFYIKGNETAKAAFTQEDQDLASSNNGESNTNEELNNNENQENSQNGTNAEETNQGEANSQDSANDSRVEETTENVTDNATNGESENIGEEFTQTDTVETEVNMTEQEVNVGWSNISLAKANMSANIATDNTDLSIDKKSTVVSTLDNDKNVVQKGSKIRYDIVVTNNDDVAINDVNISDVIPEGTKLDTKAEMSEGAVLDSNGRLSWVVDIPSENTVTVSFTVEVVIENGEIRNTAVVNGKNTPETINNVEKEADKYYYKIEYYKDSISPENIIGETPFAEAKLGTNITNEIIVKDFESDWLNKEKMPGYKDGKVQDLNGSSEGYITISADKENIIKVVYEKEKVLTVVPTKTESEVVPVPQTAILVLDFSSSMDNDRIVQLKKAVDTFLDNFLTPFEDGKVYNKAMIIEYADEIIKVVGPSSNIEDLDISNDETGYGTNIDYGLTMANKYIDIKDTANTSVILMSDGRPRHYIDENNDIVLDVQGAFDQAIETANIIKNKGVKLFTIGFMIDSKGQKLMKELATSAEDTYFDADDGTKLSQAFHNISNTINKTTDEEPIRFYIDNGKVEITSGFTEGQNVEIYNDTYYSNISTPDKKYTWKEFIDSSEYVTYSDGKITFDIGKYVLDNKLNKDDSITIRFVNNLDGTNGGVLESGMNLIANAEDEEIDNVLAKMDKEVKKEEIKEKNEKKESSKESSKEDKKENADKDSKDSKDNEDGKVDQKEENDKKLNTDNQTVPDEQSQPSDEQEKTESAIEDNEEKKDELKEDFLESQKEENKDGSSDENSNC